MVLQKVSNGNPLNYWQMFLNRILSKTKENTLKVIDVQIIRFTNF